MLVAINNFAGLRPKIDRGLLDVNAATVAENCDLLSGRVQPVETPLDITTLPTATRKSIYPYNNSWLSWESVVDVLRSPIAEDRFNRIYYTGDGVPKVRGTDPTTGIETVYNLGVQKPLLAPTVTTAQKSTVDWTRTWHYFYEEQNGDQLDPGDLTEGTGAANVRVVSAGKSFILTTIPPRVTASSSSIFVLYFDAFDENGAPMGRIYPNISISRGNSDLYVAGASITATQTNAASSAAFVLTYDASRAADYTVYRSYVYTFVTAWGEESQPSDASAVVGVDPSMNAIVSNLSAPVGSDHNIITRRIYRTVTGNSGTAFQYVGEQTLPAGDYTDTLDDDETNEVLPSTGWSVPPSDLVGIVSHPGGFFGGFREDNPKTLFFSEPNYPHSWPAAYSLTCEYPVVGLAVVGNGFIVLTTGNPFLIYGDHPDSLVMTKIPLAQGCASKRGIVVEGGVVIYPSWDGLVAIEGGSGRLITADYFQKDNGYPSWASLEPASMIGAMWDRRYHGWGNTGNLIFGLYEGPGALTSTSETVQGVYSDLETDALYIIQGANLRKWRGNAVRATATWRSKQVQLSRPWSPSCARLTCDTYPTTLKLYSGRGATLVWTRTVTDDVAFRVPILHDEKFWEIEVQATGMVTEVLISSSMAELEARKK